MEALKETGPSALDQDGGRKTGETRPSTGKGFLRETWQGLAKDAGFSDAEIGRKRL